MASLLLDNVTREVVHQLVVPVAAISEKIPKIGWLWGLRVYLLTPGSPVGAILSPRCWELAPLLADLVSDGVRSAGGLRWAARALQLVLPARAFAPTISLCPSTLAAGLHQDHADHWPADISVA